MQDGAEWWFPRLDRVDNHLDWRPALEGASEALDDFERAESIVQGAWNKVVGYLEDNWRRHLLSERE